MWRSGSLPVGREFRCNAGAGPAGFLAGRLVVVVVVSAADRKFLPALANLVGSLHHWSPGCRVVVYDLGLGSGPAREVARWRHVVVRSDHLDAGAPAHCRQLAVFAWKPLAIASALAQHDSVLWVDAGCDFRAPVDPLRTALERDGHLFVQGQDLDMTSLSHPGTYRSLWVRKDDHAGLPHFAGGVQGYTRDSRAAREILGPLVACAMDRDCIAPRGSSLSNHRYDQSALSIIIYRSRLPVQPATPLISEARSRFNPDPLQPSDRVVYTARGRSREYVPLLRDAGGGYRFPRAAERIA